MGRARMDNSKNKRGGKKIVTKCPEREKCLKYVEMTL